MKILLLTFFLISSSFLYSQDYSYSFKGTLNETNKQILEEKINLLSGFNSIKLRLKETSGIVYFTIKKPESEKEAESLSSLNDIKSLFLEYGLEPNTLQIIEQ